MVHLNRSSGGSNPRNSYPFIRKADQVPEGSDRIAAKDERDSKAL